MSKQHESKLDKAEQVLMQAFKNPFIPESSQFFTQRVMAQIKEHVQESAQSFEALFRCARVCTIIGGLSGLIGVTGIANPVTDFDVVFSLLTSALFGG